MEIVTPRCHDGPMQRRTRAERADKAVWQRGAAGWTGKPQGLI